LENPKETPEGEKLVLDFSGLPDALAKHDKALVEALVKELRKEPKPEQGKGFVEGYSESVDKVLESLQSVQESNWKMKEEWTVAIPNYHQRELRAGLRDHVWTTTVLQGEQGDVARIPYVMDFDFEILAAVGNAFAASTTGIIAGLTTTLYEAGAWTDVPYNLIERFDRNLLDELNAVFARAAVRAEDAEIMTLINAGTNTNYANGGQPAAALTGTVGRSTGGAVFYAANVPTALGRLLGMGKSATPGECVLYMTGRAYAALLAELVASTPIAHAQPSIITQGQVEKYLGVSIVVGGYRPWNQRTNAATGTMEVCYLMRGKRAVALAPKRDILIETDKQIATRQLRVTGSHTFGVLILDFKEIVHIWTSQAY
jgi:hypothetical protein